MPHEYPNDILKIVSAIAQLSNIYWSEDCYPKKKSSHKLRTAGYMHSSYFTPTTLVNGRGPPRNTGNSPHRRSKQVEKASRVPPNNSPMTLGMSLICWRKPRGSGPTRTAIR